MKTILLSTALSALATASLAQDLPQAENEWFKAGQAKIEELMAIQPNTGRAKNVILFTADGNGVGTNYAIRLFSGQQEGGLGDDYQQPSEKFPHSALVKTYSTNGQTPDSAPTASAMNTGVKTKNDLINVSDATTVGDCEAGLKNGLTTFAEIVSGMGKSVGVISTARLTHATPAAVYARTADRDWENSAEIPEGCAQKDIADQLIDQMKAGVIDVALGGGRSQFLPEGTEDAEGKKGLRTDSRNLVEEAEAAGFAFAQDEESFKALAWGDNKPVLGLFEGSHMKYEADRTGEPSLAEMTEAAIKSLSQNEQGFYLNIEGGRVDHANHDGNVKRALVDGKAFQDAIAKAAELTNPEDTLIIVTADHEHAIAFNGYCGRGTPIEGLCYKVDEAGEKHLDELESAADGKPYSVVGFLNGVGSVLVEQATPEAAATDSAATSASTDVTAPEAAPAMDAAAQGAAATAAPAAAAPAAAPAAEAEEAQAVYASPEGRATLTQEEATDIDFVQQALLPMSSETHSGEDVAVFARGPWSHLFDGVIEQNVIFHVMNKAVTAE